jgi:hypothetical protein
MVQARTPLGGILSSSLHALGKLLKTAFSCQQALVLDHPQNALYLLFVFLFLMRQMRK